MKDITLVLLCGGLGTRIRPLTENIPKALVNINSLPFIDYQLELFEKNGITKVIICCGHLGKMIEQHIRDGYKGKVKIYFSYDGENLLGTAGALVKAKNLLPDNFMVTYGDSYLLCDYQAIFKYFLSKKSKGLLTILKNENKWGKSNIKFENNRIVSYNKSAIDSSYIDYGMMCFEKKY
ncbi:MAG: NTP transferase domain-containing protein [Legionellales bacterium]|nr:NTP transferase domain-containing protein [Legionellales bacterium]